jgi:protein-S-isoprenylcysteine O-methyltransferase Ste14
MAYILLGFSAFLIFALYDINSVLMKKKFLHSFFFLGCILLMVSTLGIIISSWESIHMDWSKKGIYAFLSLMFLILLIYTLFFALPFDKTYLQVQDQPKVYRKGVYALCRHPGVLWFIGFYLFLWMTLEITQLLVAAIVFSIGNIIYIIFQDKWTFLHVFDDYHEYKKTTPFLIPSCQSIKKCIQTLS